MSHSRIGYELSDHSVISVYCHWDSENNAKILSNHYKNLDDVKNLVNNGNISVLRTRDTWDNGPNLLDDNGNYIQDEEGFIMSLNDREPQPLYYRGEKEVLHTSFDKFATEQEYCYLYTLKNKWVVYKREYQVVKVSG